MGNQPADASQGGESTPVNFIPDGAPEGSKPQESPSLQEIEARLTQSFEARVAQVKDEIRRETQSLVDKASFRTQEKINNQFRSLEQTVATQKSMGIEITDAQVAAMKQKIVTDAMAEEITPTNPPEKPEKGEVKEPPEIEPEAVNETTRKGREKMQATGIVILQGDPEAQLLVTNQGEQAWLTSLDTAIETKRQRILGNQTANTRLPTSAGGSGSYNPNPIENVKDTNELWALSKQKR